MTHGWNCYDGEEWIEFVAVSALELIGRPYRAHLALDQAGLPTVNFAIFSEDDDCECEYEYRCRRGETSDSVVDKIRAMLVEDEDTDLIALLEGEGFSRQEPTI
jgi:hypothetical protein